MDKLILDVDNEMGEAKRSRDFIGQNIINEKRSRETGPQLLRKYHRSFFDRFIAVPDQFVLQNN